MRNSYVDPSLFTADRLLSSMLTNITVLDVAKPMTQLET